MVKKSFLTFSIAWGVLATSIAGFALAYMPDELFTAPVFEELIKGIGVLLLVRFKKSVFFIDSAIYGAAVGAGFALSENIHYIAAIPHMSVGIAMIRGLATAIMHCGAVASTAVLLNWFYGSRKWCVRVYFIALIPAVLLHALYNSLIMPPVLSLPVVLFGVIGWF
ncbi:MAG: PrsW family glutamic-type intramembrane protease, partial [Phocaeicola sp.]